MKVMLVCSSGGHLAQLHRLEPWWRDHDRLWVTFDTVDARSLLRDERVEWAHHPTTRNIPNAIRNLRLARALIARERPDLVVSDGAGVAVPFFVAARRAGVKTCFIEVYDRIDSRTLTGRLVYPLVDLFCVQWEAQKTLYPRAELVGRLL
jgi:UDP-N-acetylglucosamine:LPS N-acetylglucosamine transferase